jgi:hypothetical protein
MSWAAAGAGELAAVDDQAEAAEGDAELLRGLVCGEVAGPDHLRLHDPMLRHRHAGGVSAVAALSPGT